MGAVRNLIPKIGRHCCATASSLNCCVCWEGNIEKGSFTFFFKDQNYVLIRHKIATLKLYKFEIFME